MEKVIELLRSWLLETEQTDHSSAHTPTKEVSNSNDKYCPESS